MKIGKYKKAMRPKKYLTRQFIVYKGEPYDPKENPTYGDPDTWNTKVDDYLQERGYYKEKKDEREDI